MIINDFMEYLLNNSDSRGIPVIPNDMWIDAISKYEKDDIRETFARYVHKNSIAFPFKTVDEHELKKHFYEFSRKSMLDMFKQFDDVKERYDYKYTYTNNPLGVIDKSHYYNVVSDYFQQKNRLRCGSNTTPSPFDIWNNEKLLSKMNWHFWRLTVLDGCDIDEKTIRTSFRLGTYTATQFKPSVAKALYQKHDAVNVLDTSCGWGDRLAGFYASPKTKVYVGCDPNPDVFEVYKQQCLFYERILGGNPVLTETPDCFECHGIKTVKIWRKPSEDVDWTIYNDFFDFYFTSPPYFETEKYGKGGVNQDDQSWCRYDTFEKWKNDFFFKVTKDVWKTIKKDGFMMINIIEPRTKENTRLNLCDDMVDTFKTFDGSNYIGKIGMRMMARPNTEKDELRGVFIEPIWVFRKGNSNYIETKNSSLDKFFA